MVMKEFFNKANRHCVGAVESSFDLSALRQPYINSKATAMNRRLGFPIIPNLADHKFFLLVAV